MAEGGHDPRGQNINALSEPTIEIQNYLSRKLRLHFYTRVPTMPIETISHRRNCLENHLNAELEENRKSQEATVVQNDLNYYGADSGDAISSLTGDLPHGLNRLDLEPEESICVKVMNCLELEAEKSVMCEQSSDKGTYQPTSMTSHGGYQDVLDSAQYRSDRKMSQCKSSSSTSQGKRSEKQRRDTYSSSYGSLSDTCDSDYSLPSSPPPHYLPHSNAFNDVPYELESDLYETIPAAYQHANEGTYIQTDEQVAAVQFPARCRLMSAPDMMLEGTGRRPGNFKAVINGDHVEYTPMQLLRWNDAKPLLVKHADARLGLPNKVAENCSCISSDYQVAFRHKINTLIELRSMENATKPYQGENIPPCRRRSPWDYDISHHGYAKAGEEYFKVPTTEKVITCKLCGGNGKGKCSQCGGAGQKTCSRCHGFGNEPMLSTECLQCNGGFETCQGCHGSGVGKCKECDGNRKVIAYQRLKVTWVPKKHTYIDPIEAVPKKRMVKAQGRMIYSDSADGCVKPITERELFHSTIAEISSNLIARYAKFDGAVRKQKQTVSLVLIQRFDCKYKEKPFSFYVIGEDRQIFVPYYPSRRLKFSDISK